LGPTVANGALRTWLDLQLAPPSRDLTRRRHEQERLMRRYGFIEGKNLTIYCENFARQIDLLGRDW
jgi:hypothetical protein